MQFSELEHLASAIEKLAAALGDKSAEALLREQKWNEAKTESFPPGDAKPQHPDGEPTPAIQPGPIPTAAPQQTTPQQAAPTQQQTQPQPVPTSARTYTLDELARAAGQLMDSGKQQQLLDAMHGFGVQALNQLPPQQYGAFATALRQLGAQL